ncbi:DNA methylase, partial [mine drainage metagenome]
LGHVAPGTKSPEVLEGTGASAAFVSTNSITQGEQVPVLWPRLLDDGFDIGFAHRTFEWTSEAKGMAHVHCVIVGFCQGAWRGKRWIFDYSTPRSEPHQLQVSHINPYLVEAPTVYVYKRREPLVPVPHASFGSMPNDDGNFILDDDEAVRLRTADSVAARFLREMASTRQLLHGERRWCL